MRPAAIGTGSGRQAKLEGVVIILRMRNYYNKNAVCHAVCGDRMGKGSFVYRQNVYRE